MSIKKWLSKNTASLSGKTVAITGSTGGLGQALCRHLAALGANLYLLDRSPERSEAHRAAITADFPDVSVKTIELDLEDIYSVKRVTEALKTADVDVLIHNAGAYSIPRHKCETGFDNVYQINFASPYYMTRELLPTLAARGGRVVVVGSIAHNYSKTDANDVDFSTRGKASLVYGNAKRRLMYSASELFSRGGGASLSVVHPGITFTNITAHYPKLVFAIIKYPMKIIFMRPRKASLSILKGVFDSTSRGEWIGPRAFNVWGYPKKKKLKTATDREREEIFTEAERTYEKMKNI